MSSKNQEEKKQILADLETIKSASSTEQASDDVVRFTNERADPLMSAEGNEWTAGGPSGCCTVS